MDNDAAPTVDGPARAALAGARHIAVFRALQLGDLLCSVPALRALRAAAPRARILLVGLPWAREFVARYSHVVDEFVEFPGWPGLPERSPDLAAVPGFLAQLQARRLDLAIQLHGSGPVVNEIVCLMGARATAGFFLPGQWCPDPQRFVAWPDHLHEIERWLALTTKLGAPSASTGLEFPIHPADHESLTAALAGALEQGRYVVVHAGSQLPSRRWPPARFAQVADALAALGLQVVLTGTAGEAPLVGAVRAAMHAPALDLAGRTTLGAVAALIRDAALLVCNDTGVSHIAAALGTPSAVVCSGADAARWAPLDHGRHRVLAHPVPCRPCAHAVCPIEGHPCATGTSAEAVLAQARALLDAHPAFRTEDPRACTA